MCNTRGADDMVILIDSHPQRRRAATAVDISCSKSHCLTNYKAIALILIGRPLRVSWL
jgi:hypothetical protein